MKLAITMTHATRPKYSRQSFASVVDARKIAGMTHVPIFAHCEPHPQTVAIVKALARPGDTVVENATVQKVNRNTVAAIDHGFESGADFVVHVEDDTPLAPDALAYFAWAAEQFNEVRVDERFLPVAGSIVTVAGYHREPAMPPSTRWWEARSRNWFHPWAWGTWRDRWDLLRTAIAVDEPLTWDVQVNTLMLLKDWCEVFPTLARSQNIGHYSSIHPGAYPPEWYAEVHTLKYWAGDDAFGGKPPTPGGQHFEPLPWSYAGRDVAEDEQRAQERAAYLDPMRRVR